LAQEFLLLLKSCQVGRELLLLASVSGRCRCGGSGLILFGLGGSSLLGLGLFLGRGELFLCGGLYKQRTTEVS
jgi:hypothetical protein